MNYEEKMCIMLELYKDYESDDDLIPMIVELRNSFLNHEMVSASLGYDVSADTVTGPEHVLYHLAQYIYLLEEKVKDLSEVNLDPSVWEQVAAARLNVGKADRS